MGFIDSRTYNHRAFWKNQGKTESWVKGYDAGWEGRSLAKNASVDYAEGYAFGIKDRAKEEIPPHVKDGFGYGHGFKPDATD